MLISIKCIKISKYDKFIWLVYVVLVEYKLSYFGLII